MSPRGIHAARLRHQYSVAGNENVKSSLSAYTTNAHAYMHYTPQRPAQKTTPIIIVCQMHLTDYLITLVSVYPCVSVHRSVVERLRPQFFSDFHQILHAARKCGCVESYCYWDKPEVV